MNYDKELRRRSNDQCELCKNTEECKAYEIPKSPQSTLDTHIWICNTCQSGINNPKEADVNHWRCLNESIWSETAAIQVVSWRMLHALSHTDFANDLLEISYLDEETLTWAKADGSGIDNSDAIVHKDSNGNILKDGDSVVLIKTLDVKGASFDAKMGTVVKNIRLVADNSEQIEGKVNGSQIVILTKYVRKG